MRADRSAPWRRSCMALSPRSSADDAPGLGMSAADFAWEFLRRNPRYRAEYAALGPKVAEAEGSIDPRWGLRFAVDPDIPAPNAVVYWRPEAAPGLVLTLKSAGEGGGRRWRRLSGVQASRLAEDGQHVRLASGLQAVVRGGRGPQGPMMVVLAFDEDYGLRLRAAVSLNRSRPQSSLRLEPARRVRLGRALRALDASLANESYRNIAIGLFGAEAVQREPWKTASVRDVTIRLVRAGERLMHGGYLKLLRAAS